MARSLGEHQQAAPVNSSRARDGPPIPGSYLMAARLPTRAEVLDLLGSETRPLHAREIASRLRVSDVDYLGLQRLLDDLSFEGVLAARPGQRFKLSGKTSSARGAEREGLLTVHPRGFG